MDNFVHEASKQDVFLNVMKSSTGVYIYKKAFQFATKNQLNYLINQISDYVELIECESNYSKMSSLIKYYSGQMAVKKTSKYSDSSKSKDSFIGKYRYKKHGSSISESDRENFGPKYSKTQNQNTSKYDKYEDNTNNNEQKLINFSNNLNKNAKMYIPKKKTYVNKEYDSIYSSNIPVIYPNSIVSNPSNTYNDFNSRDEYKRHNNELNKHQNKNILQIKGFKSVKQSRFFNNDNSEGDYK